MVLPNSSSLVSLVIRSLLRSVLSVEVRISSLYLSLATHACLVTLLLGSLCLGLLTMVSATNPNETVQTKL